MSDEWPDEWVSGEEKMAENLPAVYEETEYRMTNDHGLLYLVGEHTEGEWMFTEDVLPPKYQNIR